MHLHRRPPIPRRPPQRNDAFASSAKPRNIAAIGPEMFRPGRLFGIRCRTGKRMIHLKSGAFSALDPLRACWALLQRAASFPFSSLGNPGCAVEAGMKTVIRMQPPCLLEIARYTLLDRINRAMQNDSPVCIQNMKTRVIGADERAFRE